MASSRLPVRAEGERLERLPVLVRALVEAERFCPQRHVNGVSLLLAHVASSGDSGDQNGLAGQLSGRGLVMDGSQVGQRPSLRDVDRQLAGVNLIHQAGLL
jgi:hypothetical protein